MKIDDLLTLHNAGYTKEDIFRILGSTEQAPAEQPAQQPADPAPEEKQEQQQAPAPAPAEDDRIGKLETKLDYVINRFNYLAVQQSAQPQQKEESIDDILSSVVRGFQKPDNDTK